MPMVLPTEQPNDLPSEEVQTCYAAHNRQPGSLHWHARSYQFLPCKVQGRSKLRSVLFDGVS